MVAEVRRGPTNDLEQSADSDDAAGDFDDERTSPHSFIQVVASEAGAAAERKLRSEPAMESVVVPRAPAQSPGHYHIHHPEHAISGTEPRGLARARSTPPSEPRLAATGVDAAEVHFRTAEVMFANGHVRAAVFEAQKGMRLRSPQPVEQALYAWLLYQRSGAGSNVPSTVWTHLAAALSADPSCAPAHYYKGVLLEQTDRSIEAMWHFARVLELDPEHLEARRELRRLRGRQRA